MKTLMKVDKSTNLKNLKETLLMSNPTQTFLECLGKSHLFSMPQNLRWYTVIAGLTPVSRAQADHHKVCIWHRCFLNLRYVIFLVTILHYSSCF